ncbi:MAG: anti-sigma factor, partial [Solirubrobacteraceae bacterium]
ERAAQAEGEGAVGTDGQGRASSPNTSEGRRDTARRRRPWLRRGGLALAGAAVLALGVLAGVAIERPGGTDPTPLELRAVLTAPGDAARRATVGVTKTGIGRVIDLRTDDLPILPKGEYYELWWVGPGDRPGRPNRISAGTFHPDQQGRSIVTFAAAVDPKKYPTLAVTAEPGDGDPRPSTPDALRSRPEK